MLFVLGKAVDADGDEFGGHVRIVLVLHRLKPGPTYIGGNYAACKPLERSTAPIMPGPWTFTS